MGGLGGSVGYHNLHMPLRQPWSVASKSPPEAMSTVSIAQSVESLVKQLYDLTTGDESDRGAALFERNA